MTMLERMRSNSPLQNLVMQIARYVLSLHISVSSRSISLRKLIVSEIFHAPLEPILHPSPWRLKWLGILLFLGHPFFGYVWTELYPQPIESMGIRFLFGLMGLSLIPAKISSDPTGTLSNQVFVGVTWLSFPFLFSAMCFFNAGSTAWLVSLCCMVLIYYHLVDWRIATVGTFFGLFVSYVAWQRAEPNGSLEFSRQLSFDAILFGFAWLTALVLGASSANMRREHVKHTLAAMGIMAHELRTPLAIVAMIADVLETESIKIASQSDSKESSLKIDRMSSRLHTLSRQMHHQIDTQIANARLLQLPIHEERVCAYEILNDVIGRYPYRTPRERNCVQLVIADDFNFLSSFALFSQVFDNLMKNAFHALQAMDRPLETGDLRIEVTCFKGQGIVTISDRGKGIRPELLNRIFEPFFSTNRGTGHGLGLAFCERVVKSAGGTISVKSIWNSGTQFVITLPVTKNERAQITLNNPANT